VEETSETTSSQNTESTVEDSSTTEESHDQKTKKSKDINVSRKTAEEEDEDPLIKQLDKKIDKELRAIQGNADEDDDDEDIDDDTMDDLLHGERAKELDQFLKI